MYPGTLCTGLVRPWVREGQGAYMGGYKVGVQVAHGYLLQGTEDLALSFPGRPSLALAVPGLVSLVWPCAFPVTEW